jgi:putative NADH-flavin reductase
MIITVVGATGNLGRELLRQGLARGHMMRAVAPHPERAERDERVTRFKASDKDRTVLIEAFQGADVVVTVFPANVIHPETYSAEIQNVFEAAKQAGVCRIVGLVGSSGALTQNGQHLVDTDYFQETTRHYYQNVHASWDAYRQEREIDWVAVVPAARMQPHMAARGSYRVRTDGRLVVTDPDSMRYFDTSQISYADCAMAILDEVEHRRHSRVFLSVGY